MPTVAQIRAAIANKVKAVANVGQVHDFQRYVDDGRSLSTLYTATIDNVAQLRGWYLTRWATDDQSPQLGRHVVTHTWRLRGFQALDDARATEKLFDDLIEALRLAFRDDESLGGVVATTVTERAAGLQLDEQVPVMFCGVLCHSASCTLYTRHYE